jgi:hypothetical protein
VLAELNLFKMKNLTLYVVLCYAFCNAQINEDFSSNLKNWKGDTSKFVVNSTKQLQSNSSVAGNSWISIPFNLENNTSWNLWLNMAFSPSTTNLLKVYLYADHQKLDSIKNGIYFKVGKTGTTDSYDFYLQRKGKTDSLIIAGPSGWAGTSNNKATLKIIPYNHQWIIFLDHLGGENYIALDTLPQYFSGAGFFGMYCKYSASNAKKFFFDDISIGTYFPDTVVPKYGDVLITEIMADPDPSIALANQEYLELYNASSSVINLKSWIINVNGSIYTFPKILIQPAEYYILNNPPSLLNEGANISLYSKNNDLIHSVNYVKQWYGDPFKEEGGWSLEMMDISHPCLETGNWMASNSPTGGSPGKMNSVNQSLTDNIAPEIDFISTSQNEIIVHFTKAIYYTGGISINPEILIDSVFYNKFPNDELRIYLKDSLQRNTIYHLTIATSDCSGNTIDKIPRRFGLADSATQNDVVINEILFNPFSDGADFVEIYNRSNKLIDLSQLRFSSRDDKGFLSAAQTIVNHTQFIFHNEYAAFTTDKNNILQNYPTHDATKIFELSSLPALNNDVGSIALIWPNGTVIDEFTYSEKMHDQLLTNVDGVSLERINPDISQWHSAAQDIGWATPGLPNSQFLQSSTTTSEFHLQEKKLTPNEDGNKDFAMISYQLDKSGYKATINIYDASGALVKILANNFFLGTQGEFQWNGTDDSGNILPVGIYILYAEYFHDSAAVKHWKESVVLER